MVAEIEVAGEGTTRPRVMAFPLSRRIGEIRRAAADLADIEDIDESDDYRHDLAETLFADLAAMGLSEDEQDEEVGAFFHAVECALSEVFAERLEQTSIGLV